MYAVVKAGGRQIKVSHGQVVRIDKVDAEVGSTISFNDVLMVGGGLKVHLGAPSLPGLKLDAEVVDHGKAEKVLIFRKRRRKNYRRKRGFRAQFTLVRIGALHGSHEPWGGAAQA
jgi:large subunit ribosomal protein L21